MTACAIYIHNPEVCVRQETETSLRTLSQGRGLDVYEVYTDEHGYSDANLPALKQLLADAKSHKFNTVMVSALSELGFSVTSMRNVIKKLFSYKVSIECISQNLFLDYTSNCVELISACCDFERNAQSAKSQKEIKKAVKKGKVLGKPKNILSKYQIDKAKNILADNPDISQREFAEQFNGIGRRQLIEQLREMGIWQK